MKIFDEIRAVIAVIILAVSAVLFVPCLFLWVLGFAIFTKSDQKCISKAINQLNSKVE